MAKQNLGSRVRLSQRKGISLIETLFAIGILMVGMLGIAAVLSVAGKNAVDSQALASSQVLANSSLNEIYARNIQNPNNWMRPQFNIATMSWTWTSMGGLAPSAAPSESYCIDPLLFSFSSAITTPNSNYTTEYFPYYTPNLNPLIDPSIQASNSAGVAWQSIPRMRRVSVGASGVPASAKLAEEIFASQNEFAEVKSRDSTRHVVRGFESVGASIQKSATRQTYSWFATLTPKENNFSSYSPQYILSIVVVKNRDRALVIPVPSPAGLNDPTTLPSEESIAWVVPLGVGGSVGFSGGGGGRVLLVGSAATESHTTAGQWLMLSRFDPTLGRGVFSWYRIASCDQDARRTNDNGTPLTVQDIPTYYDVGALTLPFGQGSPSLPVWVREVTLAGRDWGMYSANGSINDSQVSVATIVRGVVNVHERVITLDEN